MNSLLQSQIDRICKAYAEWWGQPRSPRASEAAIGVVSDWFRAHHHGELPDQLADFWRAINGLGLDGKVFWAAEARENVSGIVNVNEMYVENFSDYFFLGKSDDIWMYAYHLAERKYRILGMFEFEHVEVEFDTFDELATTVYAEAIDRADVP